MTDHSRVRTVWDGPVWPSVSSSEYPDSIQYPQKVKTPGTSIDTKPDQGAFEVKVIGYGTNAPSLSISAPSQALTGTQDELSAPMKIIATVEHDGQQHELHTIFKSLKISHAADAEAPPVTTSTKKPVEEEKKEHRFNSLDKTTALAIKSEENLKVLREYAYEKLSLSEYSDDREVYRIIYHLSKDVTKIKNLVSPLSQFETTNDKEEVLREKILADMGEHWDSFHCDWVGWL